ncbi:porin [Pandoraea thiooxydans]|uniref:porin n=1 Tax=Pandoraea thiooxydans TaxID=445709 RepID=UPI0009F9827E|nr:porin [Pandoraea thiooxydans]
MTTNTSHGARQHGARPGPARRCAACLLGATFAAVGLGAPLAAQAQSSVTLYGLIDAGIDYTTNVAGNSQTSLDTGILSPNLFGMRGSEDLGGGLHAKFVLEGQFNAGNGALIGNEFGRQAYIGLTDAKWGSVTLGNQYDFMFTSLSVKRYGPMFPLISLQNLRQGPFNALNVPNRPTGAFDFDRMAGEQIANAVKYESPDLAGLTFGAMLGVGGQPGSFSRDSAQSFGADYRRGPIQLDAAYTFVRYPSLNNGNDGIRNWGIGGRTALGKGFVDLLYTSTANTATGAHVDVYEIGGMMPLAAATHLALAYQYMKGNAVLEGNRAQQINATLDYSLSIQTDLYTTVTYQHANGPGAQAQILAAGPASGGNQAELRIGMRHFF